MKNIIFLLLGILTLDIYEVMCRGIDGTIGTPIGTQSHHDEVVVDGIYSDEATTKRPGGDIGFQNILQGLLKAPAEIAIRVQGVIDGILRRSTPPTPKKFF